MHYVCHYCGTHLQANSCNNIKCLNCGYTNLYYVETIYETDECPICLKNFENNNSGIYLECGHKICNRCYVDTNKCFLCNKSNINKIYDPNYKNVLSYELIKKMPTSKWDSFNHKYIIIFMEWYNCRKEYKKLHNIGTFCTPFRTRGLIKLIKKYYDQYLINNFMDDNITFYWKEHQSFHIIYHNMFKTMYPNSYLCNMNNIYEYNTSISLEGKYNLFIKELTGKTAFLQFNNGDTISDIRIRYSVKNGFMGTFNPPIIYAGRNLEDSFVLSSNNADTTLHFVLNLRGD